MTSYRISKYVFYVNAYLVLHIYVYSLSYINRSRYACANITPNYIYLLVFCWNYTCILQYISPNAHSNHNK